MPLIAVLVSLSAGCAAVAVLASACLVVVCRRKGGPGSAMAPPAGPAHWSTTVTVTPECRQRGGKIFLYRVRQVVLHMRLVDEFPWLVGHFCSYPLPKQDC